jgi:hypothetical protein
MHSGKLDSEGLKWGLHWEGLSPIVETTSAFSLSLSLSLFLFLLFSMICITEQSMNLDCDLLLSVGEVNLKLYWQRPTCST